MVDEVFNWYAPESGEKEIFSLLRGKGDSFVDVVLRDGQPCGFLATEYSQVKGYVVCYHIGVSIHEQDRQNGLYRLLTNRALARERVDFIAARTQNPALYESLRRQVKQVGQIYPADGVDPPPIVIEIGKTFCTSDELEPNALIVRRAYGHVREDRSYMKARDQSLNAYFAANLERNDGFIVVARCRDNMGLYDLRVTVVEIRGRSVCGLDVGDYFEITHSNQIRIPDGKHICYFALSSILPLISAKQRQNPARDWIELDSRVACPDPDEVVIWEITRTGWRTMDSSELT
jgi:uncharacterized repeat protein (TIGR04076 family)